MKKVLLLLVVLALTWSGAAEAARVISPTQTPIRVRVNVVNLGGGSDQDVQWLESRFAGHLLTCFEKAGVPAVITESHTDQSKADIGEQGSGWYDRTLPESPHKGDFATSSIRIDLRGKISSARRNETQVGFNLPHVQGQGGTSHEVVSGDLAGTIVFIDRGQVDADVPTLTITRSAQVGVAGQVEWQHDLEIFNHRVGAFQSGAVGISRYTDPDDALRQRVLDDLACGLSIRACNKVPLPNELPDYQSPDIRWTRGGQHYQETSQPQAEESLPPPPPADGDVIISTAPAPHLLDGWQVVEGVQVCAGPDNGDIILKGPGLHHLQDRQVIRFSLTGGGCAYARVWDQRLREGECTEVYAKVLSSQRLRTPDGRLIFVNFSPLRGVVNGHGAVYCLPLH